MDYNTTGESGQIADEGLASLASALIAQLGNDLALPLEFSGIDRSDGVTTVFAHGPIGASDALDLCVCAKIRITGRLDEPSDMSAVLHLWRDDKAFEPPILLRRDESHETRPWYVDGWGD